jgi:asparagine synthase (glutamine-hydrolysing)
MINDLYSESAVKRRGIFNYDVIRKMIDDNTAGREDYAHRIWCLLTLELWFQQFIDSSTSRS